MKDPSGSAPLMIRQCAYSPSLPSYVALGNILALSHSIVISSKDINSCVVGCCERQTKCICLCLVSCTQLTLCLLNKTKLITLSYYYYNAGDLLEAIKYCIYNIYLHYQRKSVIITLI